MNNFSPNMLKTYQNCPRKYYFRYIENINIPMPSTPFEKGKKIHALANYSLCGIKIDRLEAALNENERKAWDLLKQNEYFYKDYFKSEFALSAKIADYWIGGRIDAIVKDFDNYYILDYKTGAAPCDAVYDFQTMVYMICVDKYLKKYDSLSFVYIDLKNNTNKIIEFNKNLEAEYHQKISNICKTISNDTIYNCNRQNCKNCEYLKLCIS